MIRTDIGEIVISIKKNGTLNAKKIDYVFTPSFENLSKLGEPSEIINTYAVLLSNDAHNAMTRFKEPDSYVIKYIAEKLFTQLDIAKTVLTSCCPDDITVLIGDEKKKGLLQPKKILMLARNLLDYGISGRANVRISQRNKNKSYSSEFKITDYINNARVHLGLLLDEAKTLTMTEYIMLMANKYPDNDGFTSEEYDQVLDDYEKRRKERLAKAKKHPENH